MLIGVFDSGIGGEAVAHSIRVGIPDAQILRVSDQVHVPYGNRSPAEILRLTRRAIQPLLDAGCDVIVIACNTATSAAIAQLRVDYPQQQFIGLEPMVKPAAALTTTKIVAVCATPATLASPSYKRLKRQYGARLTFIEPDCSEWARLIESNQMNRRYIDDVTNFCIAHGADVIVLACTHYHWIKEEITASAVGRAIVIEPSHAIVRRILSLTESK